MQLYVSVITDVDFHTYIACIEAVSEDEANLKHCISLDLVSEDETIDCMYEILEDRDYMITTFLPEVGYTTSI